jgi:glutamate/tyrosine decarboxylase-like PLP-dependent enzyme
MTSRLSIPRDGRNPDELLETMRAYRAGDANWRGGRTFSLVYNAGDVHHEFIRRAHDLFLMENALNPMAFKSLKRMEAEVVQMAASMFHGPPSAVGTMTSGGTESILMAVKAYRDRARSLRPWVLQPEMVAPESIHVAFDKAAHYFDVKLKHVPMRDDLTADVDAMRAAINRNTILLAASAPQYPHGVLDPIEAIGALAEREKIPFHVDASIGGFMLPWVERLGYPMKPFDFRVSGVTSISADIHKYGLGAKGASVIVYRDMDHLKHQFFIATEWPGGIYASPSALGTRAGGPIAAAWAALNVLGEEGYLSHARRAMEASTRLQSGIASIPGLAVMGSPVATLVAWRSTDKALDLYAVADQMELRGWHIDRQQKPPSVHSTIMSNHLDFIDEYLRDVREAVDFVRAHPELKSSGNAAMYGMMAKVPFRGMIRRSIGKVMETMYGPAGTNTDPMKADESDGPVMKFINKYGGTVVGALDKLGELRETLPWRKPR